MEKVALEDITVRYGKKVVLDHFSMHINSGQIIGIVGPSGCGKTTIVRTICGFVTPDTGTVSIGGKIMFSREKRVNVPPEQRGVGVVFQDYAVWPHLSVYDNIAYPLKKHHVEKNQISAVVEEALGQVNMIGYAKYMPNQLSGGQQQRVAIARALTSSKSFLIMDEPITNLDAKLREQMLIEIRMMQEELGTTILYITHDQEAAMQLCDQILIMQSDGSIAQIGTDEEIITHPSNRFVFTFIGVSNFLPVFLEGGVCKLDLEGKVCVSPTIPEDFPKGTTKAMMGVRPMDILFDDASPIRAQITQAIFLGNMYNYFVSYQGKELRVQRLPSGDELDDRYHEGAEVGLRFVQEHYFDREASE